MVRIPLHTIKTKEDIIRFRQTHAKGELVDESYSDDAIQALADGKYHTFAVFAENAAVYAWKKKVLLTVDLKAMDESGVFVRETTAPWVANINHEIEPERLQWWFHSGNGKFLATNRCAHPACFSHDQESKCSTLENYSHRYNHKEFVLKAGTRIDEFLIDAESVVRHRLHNQLSPHRYKTDEVLKPEVSINADVAFANTTVLGGTKQEVATALSLEARKAATEALSGFNPMTYEGSHEQVVGLFQTVAAMCELFADSNIKAVESLKKQSVQAILDGKEIGNEHNSKSDSDWNNDSADRRTLMAINENRYKAALGRNYDADPVIRETRMLDLIADKSRGGQL